MSLRILLISPKHADILKSPPLGVGYIMQHARKTSDISITLLDENFLDDPDAEIVRMIREHHIHFVGIGFPSSAVIRVLDICRLVRSRFGNTVTIFAGGYHPTSEPELTLRLLPLIDFIVVGEAEQTVSRLTHDWTSIENVAYLKGNEFIQNPATYITNIDEIPYPSRAVYDSRYFMPTYGVIAGIYGKVATIMSSRGCPYSCNFCSSGLIQKTVRFHSTAYIMSEIEHILSEVGSIDYLYFLDVMFLAKWNRVEELCSEFIRGKIHRRFKWAATVAANVVDDHKIRLMKEAGCFYLSFGFESNSAKVLKLINKRATPGDNARACELCKKHGIYINSAFLFGVPGEDQVDLQATIDFVRTHNVHFTGVNMMKPLPGSPFYYEFKKQALISPSISEWHTISSINVAGKIYNDKITEETYNRYRDLFLSIIKYKSAFNDFMANYRKRIKYCIQS